MAKFTVASIGGLTLLPKPLEAKAEVKNDIIDGNITMPEGVENTILLMQEEIRQALKKPVEERHWGMVIDTRKCIGCDACTVSCKAENNTPPGVAYNVVMEEETGVFPNVRKKFIRRPCMQCQEPPCVPVCPVGATWKREDKIVTIDYDQCIGCRYCMVACPYGARYFDYGDSYSEATPEKMEYENRESYDYGKNWGKKDKWRSPVGNVRKCTFCLHRLEKGLLPGCVTTCIGATNYFGDLNNENSIVSKLITQRQGKVLKEEMGTEPSVFYLD